MNEIIIGGICLIFCFIIGIFLTQKKSDILSCLANFVIYGKNQNKSDEDIKKAIGNMLDIMLKGHHDFEQDPKAAYEKLRQNTQQTEEMKALIKANKKLIKKTKKSIN